LKFEILEIVEIGNPLYAAKIDTKPILTTLQMVVMSFYRKKMRPNVRLITFPAFKGLQFLNPLNVNFLGTTMFSTKFF
jgi:hypothetical protein